MKKIFTLFILGIILLTGAVFAESLDLTTDEQIEEFVRGRFDISMDFRLQEKPLGLGHAIHLGLDPDDEEVLVILGDTILDLDMKEVLKKGVTALGVKEVADPRKLIFAIKLIGMEQ